MAPISKTETFTVSLNPTEVRERTLAWFGSTKHTLTVDEADRFEVKSGSQAKLRFLGGAFIGPASLPSRTLVTMEPVDGQTRVTVTASDAIGFGAKTGIKAKYTARVEEIATELRAVLTAH